MNNEELVLFREQFAAGIYTLNRPKAKNALTLDMIHALRAQVRVCPVVSLWKKENLREVFWLEIRNGMIRNSSRWSLELDKETFALEGMSKVSFVRALYPRKFEEKELKTKVYRSSHCGLDQDSRKAA